MITRKRYNVRPWDAQGIMDFDFMEDARAYHDEVVAQGRKCFLTTRADVAQITR